MTAVTADPADRRAGSGGRAVRVPLHLLAGAVVVAGILAQAIRPLAPPLTGPVDPAAWFDAAYLARASAYRSPLYVASLAGLLIRLTIPLLVAFTRAGQRLAARIVGRVGQGRPARAAAAVVLAVVVATDVAVLPLGFWAGYVHEGAWGFRTQGLAGWAYDWFVARAPAWLVVGALTAAGFALARRAPRAWPAVAGLGGAVLTVLLVFAAPLILEPLRYRTTPLEPGPLRDRITAVLAAADQPVSDIVVADASRRTTKQNAYISGLGATRRVVLYDTLAQARPPEEVAMVLAHELGHHRNADLPRGTLFGAAGVVSACYVLWLVARRRTRGSRQEQLTDPRGAPVLLAVAVMLTVASAPVQQAVSRRAEAAADHAALELTADADTFLAMNEALARSNLSHPDPPTWVRVLWASHPSAAERLAAGEQWTAREGPAP